ncbi:MAG: T9SS type A sorting domain-containing protein [Bacteroidetes bacterium]|nr:T9SS type A sorting domain-containing protein [Bacteroidota bacterium]
MKKNLQLFLFCSILILSAQNLFSQGLNAIIAPDNLNVVAAGNNGNIFRSSNGGASWSRTIIGSVNYKSITSFGDDVWISGSDGKVYKTSKVNSPLNGIATGTSNSLNGISFTSLTTGFVCADGGLIYKTTDAGFNWTLSNSGIPNVKLNAINFRDANYGVTVGDNGKIYLTDNGGASWTAVTSGTTRNLLAVKAFGTGTIITGEWGTLISLTGVTAAIINSRVNSDIRAISGTSFTDVHIVGGGGFIRNNKNSSNEFLNFEINPMMGNLADVNFLDATTGFAVSSLNNAIIKTTNGGQSWQLTAGNSANITYSQKLTSFSGIGNGLCLHPNNRDAIFVCYGRTIYRSFNRGENWTQIATIPNTLITSNSTHSFYVSPLDTSVFIAACESAPNDRVIRSTDYGTTWSVILNSNFTSYGTPLEIDHVNPAIFYYAPDGGGFYKSTNSGATFTEISGIYPFRSPCDISVSWEEPNVIILADGVTSAAQPADLFKSTNGGVNWVKVFTNPGTGGNFSEIPCIMNSRFDKNLLYITNWSGNMRFKSTNGGDNWFSIQSTSFSGWTGEICQEDPSLVLTGRYGQSVSLSTNSGANWTEFSLPSGNCGAGTIVPARDYLISQQCDGVLKMKIQYDGADIIEEGIISNNVPSDYSLYQNFPNPFNPTTEIRYDIKSGGMVKLKIYSEEGRNIYTLVDGNKNAGTYSVKFDASNFSSGVYYYTLETVGNLLTKKMVLVK